MYIIVSALLVMIIPILIFVFKKKQKTRHVHKKTHLPVQEKNKGRLLIACEGLEQYYLLREFQKQRIKKGDGNRCVKVICNSLCDSIILCLSKVVDDREDHFWEPLAEDKSINDVVKSCGYNDIKDFLGKIKEARDWGVAHFDEEHVYKNSKQLVAQPRLEPCEVIFIVLLREMIHESKQDPENNVGDEVIFCDQSDCIADMLYSRIKRECENLMKRAIL